MALARYFRFAASFCLFSGIVAIAAAAVGAERATLKPSVIVSLDGPSWLLATDPKNVGRNQQWWQQPVAEAKAVKVPSTIQETFPGYHGVAWYWRDLTAPVNPEAQGRYVLRFWQVDYLANVWLNGVHVGQHEGVGEPFEFDVTEAIKPGSVNRLAIRVLNPTNEPIDEIRLKETPHSAKSIPWIPGGGLNWGGIIDSVELLVTPAVRIEDIFVRPDPNTGKIRVQINVRNAGKEVVRGQVICCVAPAVGGTTLNSAQVEQELPPGDTLVEAELTVENLRLWELNDPYLYRVTARANAGSATSFDERSTRCGFRDFRLEDGYFRLNGRRLFLKSAHTDSGAPIGTIVAPDPDLLRKDLVNAKTMGFNMVRFFNGLAPRYQYDFCDVIGLLAYREHYGAWDMAPSPKLAERFNRSTLAMVRRDRNHPCLVMWGILNEIPPGPTADLGHAALPLVRALDDSRMVMLNSGATNGAFEAIANPGVSEWQPILADKHPYQILPHTAGIIHNLRTVSDGQKPVFASEYGIGSALDLPRLMRHYEQLGNVSCEDAVHYRKMLDRFMVDWRQWNMGDTFANPEEYFRQCVAWMAPIRKLGINAIRSNPNIIGYSATGLKDPGLQGEGMTATAFRELKPGAVDAVFDAFSPLRWCLFVEPVQVYRGRRAKVEAVLANEDRLAPGDYPVRLQVVGPNSRCAFDRTITLTIPDPKAKPEPAFAIPVFLEDVTIDGPSGKYRFLATFEKGAAAAGGEVEFYVADAAEMPKVDTEVVLWGDDPDLEAWLGVQGIKTRAFVPGVQSAREVILVGDRPATGEAEAFRELSRHIARGSHVVFLVPDVFKKDEKAPTYWLPLVNKGNRIELPNHLFHADDWTKNHAIFHGMPAGGIMNHDYYRELKVCAATSSVWSGLEVPAEVVAASINTCAGYESGLLIAVYNLGAGRFTLNMLNIRDKLDKDPVAERLLRNMLRYAARDADKPLAELPADFDAQLKAMGY